MITRAEIIDQPYSGKYKEKIFDVTSAWNSQSWTWIRFEEDDLTEWCGEFRGEPLAVALSKKFHIVLVLTSDYLYQVNCLSGELITSESNSHYQSLTGTPSGVFVIADYSDIMKIESNLDEVKQLKSPVKMDNIKFGKWSMNKLSISCDEFLNWENHIELELDGDTLEITRLDKT